MGPFYHDPWVQTPIPRPAAPIHRYPSYYSGRPPEEGGAAEGGVCAAGQERHQDTAAARTTRWVLLHVFCHTQEKRRTSPRSRSARGESLAKADEIPHAFPSSGSSGHVKGPMVHNDRSEGCVLSNSNPSFMLEVPPVRFRREGLRIHGPSLRAFPGTEDIHQMHGGSPRTLGSQGCDNPELPRRLASLRTLRGGRALSHMQSGAPHTAVGFGVEPREESLDSIPDCDIHRDLVECTDNEGVSPVGEGGDNPLSSEPVSAGSESVSVGLPASIRLADSSLTAGSPRPSPSQASPALVQLPQMSPKATQTSPPDGDDTVHEGTVEVALTLLSLSRSGAVQSVSQGASVHGLLPDRLGSGAQRQVSEWPVEGPLAGQPHQCLGAQGCTPGSPEFPPIPEGQTCIGEDRQCHSGSLHQPPRRVEISPSAQSGREVAVVGSCTSSFSSGSVHSWRSEHSSGHALEGRAARGRLASAHSSSAAALDEVRPGPSRPFCRLRERSVPTLVLSDVASRTTRSGCSSPRLARGTAVCVSSSSSDSSSVGQDQAGWSQVDTNCPVLAEAPMVQSAVVSPCGDSMAVAPEARPALAGRRDPMASRTTAAQPVGLAPERRRWSELGLQEGVIATLQGARAPSTNVAYDLRWRIFSSWCAARNLDPESCNVQAILLFLQSCLDKGLSASTVKVYLAAISAGHVQLPEGSVGRHPLVSRFMKGARRQHPARVRKAVHWDLDIVLSALARPPFEPLESTSLKNLSMKVAFLLAITSTKRVGELHALSVSPECFQMGPDRKSVVLRPNPSFLPKVLPDGYVNSSWSLSAFSPSAVGE